MSKKRKEAFLVEKVSDFVTRTKDLLSIEKDEDVLLRKEENEHFSHKVW